MAKLFNEDGSEVEAFTPEELAAKLKEQEDAMNAKKADEEKNFSKLRQEKEEAEKKLADKEQEITQKERDKSVQAISAGNKELAEKIHHHLKRFDHEIKTEEDFQRVLNDAYVLSAGHQIPDELQDAISSGGSKGNNKGGGEKKLPISPEAMNVASKMGLTEEEIKEANNK